jgi:hypothetical protein
VERFCERIRDFDDAWSARVEMMRCLSAADPNKISVVGDSIRVETECCIFVFVDDRHSKPSSLICATVLPLAEVQEEDERKAG